MKVPQAARDELGYSIVSRHAQMWHHRDDLGLWQAWTGAEANHLPMLEVVAGARKLAAFVFPGARDPQRQFLRQHTLAPYFIAFMDAPNKASTLESLLGEAPSVARCFERSLFPQSSRVLRFCPVCAGLQMRRGFPYWTRTAQFPGLSRCVLHGVELLLSDVTVTVKRSNDRLQPLDRSILARCKVPCIPQMRRDLEARVAVRSLYALHRGLGRTDAHSVGVYRRRLMHLGYANSRGTLLAKQFDSNFRRWLAVREASPADFGPGSWWMRLVTRIGLSVVPLQHILLQEFISSISKSR